MRDWVLLREGDAGQGDVEAALFLIPGMGGSPLTFQSLADRIEGGRSVYGFEYPGADGGEAALGRLDEIVTRCLDELLELQPTGPVHLAGYSFGALVAYESACRLGADGREVGVLALLDGQVPGSSRPRPRAQRLAVHARRLLSKDGLIHLKARVAAAFGRKPVGAPGGELGADDESVSEATRQLFAASKQALTGYRPSRYPGRVALFIADPQPWQDFLIVDPDRGWADIAEGGVDRFRIPGLHLEIFHDENVKELARGLDEVLSRAEASG